MAYQGFKRHLVADVHHFHFWRGVMADLWSLDRRLAGDYRQCGDGIAGRDRSLLKVEIYIKNLSHTFILLL